MINTKTILGTRRFACAALFALFTFVNISHCQSLIAMKDRIFYEKKTVVNPLLESPTWLPSLRIVRPAAGVAGKLEKCKFSGGTIDPYFDYWLLEWPEVIYFETALRDGRPQEVETRGHEICLTKVTHATTLDLAGEPDAEYRRIWEIEFESDTGRTGPRRVKRHNAKLMNVCKFDGKKIALWRYDDRICMPNRRTVTDATRSFQFRQRKDGRSIPVHGWRFVSVAEKHLADPRPGGAIPGIKSAGQQRRAQQRKAREAKAAEAKQEAPVKKEVKEEKKADGK